MFAVVERDNDITIGTVFNEPNPFVYLVFVMGVCNIDENQEQLSSKVNAKSIGQVMDDMSYEEICAKLKAISKWSADETAIYEWSTYQPGKEDKKIVTQIVTDAEYHEGVLTLRFNHNLWDVILNLKKYYADRIDEIIKQL
ncbi:MAG: hypothetical protein II842_00600 [Butyrivibrio sp.]|nr:hypothetical protein [Butyrivibrio sp.]